jgi:hypothetical protein
MNELRKLGISFQVVGSSLVVNRPASLGGAITLVSGQKLKTTIGGQVFDVKVHAISTDASSIFKDMTVECNRKIFYLYNVDRFEHFFSIHSDKLGPTLDFWKSIVHDVFRIEYVNSGKIIMNHRLNILAGQTFKTTIARKENWGAWAKQRIDFDFSLRLGKPIIIYGKFLSFDQKDATISVDFNLMEKIAMGVGVLGLGLAAATYMGKKDSQMSLPSPETAAMVERNEGPKIQETANIIGDVISKKDSPMLMLAPPPERAVEVQRDDLLKAGIRAKLPEIEQKFPQGPTVDETANIIREVDKNVPSIEDLKRNQAGTNLFLDMYKDNPKGAETGFTLNDMKESLAKEKHGGGVRTFKVSMQDATIMFWQNLQLTK